MLRRSSLEGRFRRGHTVCVHERNRFALFVLFEFVDRLTARTGDATDQLIDRRVLPERLSGGDDRSHRLDLNTNLGLVSVPRKALVTIGESVQELHQTHLIALRHISVHLRFQDRTPKRGDLVHDYPS